ncbi:MAG: transglycosylase domain-containing protein [Butyrivibrio sp.]|nr:transglycosylase domain-containing protein [Butyrivibrio sp.]
MNYGKRGIVNQAKALNSGTNRWGNKLSLFGFCFLLSAIVGLAIIGTSAGIGAFNGIKDNAPAIEGLAQVKPSGIATFVYDTEGNKIAKLVSENANRIPVGDTSDTLKHAFVAIEDERFYDHNGIDIQGIIRAGFRAVTTGRATQGASTITQQLLKNNLFKGWMEEKNLMQKVKRKIQEQYCAVQLEQKMSKDEILINYLNTINLGNNTLGIEAASQRYFNKHAEDLTLSECAVIASITQNPTKYNPIQHAEDNAERRKRVLNKMLAQGYITQIEYDEAMADDVYSRIQKNDTSVGGDGEVNSYFVDALTDYVLKDLQKKGGMAKEDAENLLYSGGLKIYSTMDPNIQKICDTVFLDESNYPDGTQYLLEYRLSVQKSDGSIQNYSSQMLEKYYGSDEHKDNPFYKSKFDRLFSTVEDARACAKNYLEEVLEEGDTVIGKPQIDILPQPQISMTIEEQSTGNVVAMIGGRGQKTGNRTFNRATGAPRQPGSTFKILSTYAPGIDSGKLTLATSFFDAPFAYANGRPVKNWYGANSYRDYNPVREAIRESMNVITVQAFTLITPQLGFDYLKTFGFTTLVENEVDKNTGKTMSDIGQATALGGLTKGVTNLELNAAYAAIANGGEYIKPKLYSKIVDQDDNIILDNTEPEKKRVLKETTCFLLTSAMQDVVTTGTGSNVNFGTTPIAGKTGTTTDYNDVWFAGYTNYYTATTWAGFDNNTKLKSSPEKKLAQNMWKAVMEEIHKDLPASAFNKPEGIVSATVCKKSGKLPIPGVCDGDLCTEYFEEGTVPTESCDVHYVGKVCPIDHCPACEGCPFQYDGVLVSPSIPPEIQSGFINGAPSGAYTTTTDEEGNTVMVPKTCHHNPEFMQQEGIEGILAGERAQAEAEAAAAQAAQNPAPEGGDPNAGPPAPMPGPPAPEPPALPDPEGN